MMTVAARIANYLVKNMVKDACIKYKSIKKQIEKKRIIESQKSKDYLPKKQRSKPQELMMTTFDVSPETSDDGIKN